MHALARAPSFSVSPLPRRAASPRTRAPAQAASSSANPPSRPAQTTATDEPVLRECSREANTAERLTKEARKMSPRLGRGRGRGRGRVKAGDWGRVKAGDWGRVEAGDGGRVKAGDWGRVEAGAERARVIALVPLVVVQMRCLPCTASLVNSSGELPRWKPGGLAAWRSPARRAAGCAMAAVRACATVPHGVMDSAPLARAVTALVVKRSTSMTTTTSARGASGARWTVRLGIRLKLSHWQRQPHTTDLTELVHGCTRIRQRQLQRQFTGGAGDRAVRRAPVNCSCRIRANP